MSGKGIFYFFCASKLSKKESLFPSARFIERMKKQLELTQLYTGQELESVLKANAKWQ